jgi:uncharacterized LabA/DUF88 family protein
MPSIRNVGLFVDWNTQLRQAPKEFENNPSEKSSHALKSVGKLVAKVLCALDDTTLFRVRSRFYHGWTTGITQTVNRRALSLLPELLTPDDLFPSVRILAQSDVEFGDRLIDALPNRLVKGAQVHLPNTFRKYGESPEEKMVDTALAVDLLSWARQEPNSIALVFSSDDDIVPPVFVAEAWMKPMGGQVILVRARQRGESRFLILEGLLHDYTRKNC